MLLSKQRKYFYSVTGDFQELQFINVYAVMTFLFYHTLRGQESLYLLPNKKPMINSCVFLE